MASRLALPEPYPRVSWEQFAARWLWGKQGDHLYICNATGGGKTTLLSRLARQRKYVVVFVTKLVDDTFEKLFVDEGYTIVTEWPPPIHASRILLWPARGWHGDLDAARALQMRVFRDALNHIFPQGRWTLVMDEFEVMCKKLGMLDLLDYFNTQARSAGISMAEAFQRPANVPLNTYSGADHAFIGKINHGDDAITLSKAAGVDPKRVLATMASLEKREYLYVPARGTGLPLVTSVTLRRV